MNSYFNRGLFLFILCCLMACVNAPEYPVEPHILNARVSKTTVKQLGISNSESETQFDLFIEFQDGDGDIGQNCGSNEDDCPKANAFIKDNRDGFIDSLTTQYLSPNSSIDDISAVLKFTIVSECCIAISGISCTPDADYGGPTQTITYDIFIEDRAGNMSNTITTPPIILICQE